MSDQEAGQEPQEAPPQETQAEVEPQTFSADYVKELRTEAAKHRTEKNAVKEELEAIKTERDKATEVELAEQGKWQELAEKNAAKVAEFEAKAQEWDAATAKLGEALEAQKKDLPEAITELLGAMSVIQQLEWLAKHQGEYGPQAAGQPGLTGFNPSAPNGVNETDQQRVQRLRRQTGQADTIFGSP